MSTTKVMTTSAVSYYIKKLIVMCGILCILDELEDIVTYEKSSLSFLKENFVLVVRFEIWYKELII